jgi:hypothetical protein
MGFGEQDLRTLLTPESTALVSVVTPAHPVRLPAGAAEQTALADPVRPWMT